MPKTDIQQKVFNAVLQATNKVMAEIEETEGKEALAKMPPSLLVLAVGMMVQTIGRNPTAKVLESISEQVEKGDFDHVLQASGQNDSE